MAESDAGPYLDVVTINSSHLSSGKSIAKEGDHTKLLIEPISIPGLQHTGLKTSLVGSKSPKLFYANGLKTATFHENMVSYLGGEQILTESENEKPEKPKLGKNLWDFPDSVSEKDTLLSQTAARNIHIRELGSPTKSGRQKSKKATLESSYGKNDRQLDSRANELVQSIREQKVTAL